MREAFVDVTAEYELGIERRLAKTFADLNETFYAGDDFASTFQAIVDAAVTVVGGCDHASIMRVRSDGSMTTAVSTDEVAAYIDTLERRYREGPCFDAIVDSAPQFEPDLTRCEQWPHLTRDVLRHTSVRGAAGFRLLAGDVKIGALNLFSDTAGGLTETSADEAIVLASFASVAVTTAHHRHEASTLAGGIESNREIGKAVGLLMAFHKVSDVEAFDLLRKASQEMNVKLSVVAREVVQHHNSGHPAAP